MRQHIISTALGLALAAGGCAAAAPRPANTQLAGVQCENVPDVARQVADLYAPGNVNQVTPLYRTQQIARNQVSYVAGARLYVPAQHGVTREYLERVLSCHAASQSAEHANDPLRAASVRDVDVASRGQRFLIEIEGVDRAAGKQILQTAQALHQPSSDVSVRQLSAAEHTSKGL